MGVDSAGFWRYAADHPDKTAVIDAAGAAHSYGELLSLANRMSHLLGELGVGPGSAVAFSLANRPEAFVCVFGALQIGARCVPIGPSSRPAEAGYVLGDADVGVFVADATATGAGDAAARAGIDPVRCFGVGDEAPFPDLAAALAAMPESTPSHRSAGAVVCYTSGTTGKPKGVVRREFATMEDLVADALELAAIYGWADDGVALVQGPLYHAGPLSNALNMLHVGGRVVLMADWDPEACLAAIDRYRVTASMMVPTMLRRLLELPAEVRAAYDVSSLRPNAIVLGGAICPPADKRAMIEWWGPVFMESYGGTEGTFARITSQDWLEHPGSVGRAWRGVTLTALRSDGTPCDPLEVGTIYARFSGSRPAYLNANEKTAASYRGDYFTLGDLGYLDDDGWLHIVDRRDDLIITGGVNVYPAEVEAVLQRAPGVADVAVIGVPDATWGHRVVAVVQPRDTDTPPDAEAILRFCREELAPAKCPREITFRAKLPRSSLGKLLRSEIRDELLARRSAGGTDGHR